MSLLESRIFAIITLDISRGKRIVSKYYTDKYRDIDAQFAFEAKLYKKIQVCSKTGIDMDVFIIDNCLVAFLRRADIYEIVVTGKNENELILKKVLHCLDESLTAILEEDTPLDDTGEHMPLDLNTIFEHLDVLFIIIDEMIDDGIILCDEAVHISERISGSKLREHNSIKNMINTTKEHLLDSLW